MTDSVVAGWFGPHFARLHPTLQQLHRDGGILTGDVDLAFGRGLAGWFGRRLARKMGLPTQAGRLPLEVTISHTADALVWARRFGEHAPMVSTFQPEGHWPDGCFHERTGSLHLDLGVDIDDGGWTWKPLRARLHGLAVPIGLLPRSHASKRIEHGAYRFEVAFIAPGLGLLLRYGGLLAASPAGTRPPGSDAAGSAA